MTSICRLVCGFQVPYRHGCICSAGEDISSFELVDLQRSHSEVVRQSGLGHASISISITISISATTLPRASRCLTEPDICGLQGICQPRRLRPRQDLRADSSQGPVKQEGIHALRIGGVRFAVEREKGFSSELTRDCPTRRAESAMIGQRSSE